MDNTAAVRAVNNNSNGGGDNFVSLAMASGGWLPPSGSGLFSAVVIGRLAGVDEATVRRWVRDHKIPYRKAGKTMFLDPGDFARFLPHGNDAEE